MPATKISSNKHTALHIGVRAAIADVETAILPELQALTNASNVTKWDGYDFGVEASETDEDRVLTDAATAATRGYENFGGSIAFFPPLPGEVGTPERAVRSLVSTPHTELVLTQRDGYAASAAWAPGQVYNAFHVITDANSEQRGDKNRFYTIDFRPKGAVGINRIVPSLTPTAVAITGPAAVGVGESIQLRAAYEGNDITVGAVWVSSDESIAVVTPHGKVIGIADGEVEITATYPGSAAGTAHEITVSA
ncbi:Ig-like domain-containing protein [Microbacterium sp. zg-YB36]|uniref:Ig-like domain-containing protein n=1 Tax=Microbacterium sp. zg-YB36 TaxID=2969407 RepID=UPI00214B4FF3|nr:Ig-like domain-containing protein [Microbacterium sp. zg-YB36]MDL5351100.1 Ig-like domain-containing protein [Microbacterium sp. zg-YB36]